MPQKNEFIIFEQSRNRLWHLFLLINNAVRTHVDDSVVQKVLSTLGYVQELNSSIKEY